MTEMSNDISGYSGNDFRISEDGLDVDFSRAKLLKTTGTICDAYEYRQGTRRVFVKKLKSRFQNSPRHRAALGKEYEIGVSLSHPSLAVYRYAKNDYIVADFIDGKTLASMIQSRDPWLESGENALKILRELNSVIGYLHDRNLVHSDIKADNVIITNGTHNAVLVDLDKCHSSSLDMVSGNPGLYGVQEEETGNPQIDFNGLARIAEKLSGIVKSTGCRKLLRRFVKVCGSTGGTPDKILEDLLLRKRGTLKTAWIPVAVLVALVAVFVMIFYATNRSNMVSEDKTVVVTQNENGDSIVAELDLPQPDVVLGENIGKTDSQIPVKPLESADLENLNGELEQIYYPLYGQIDMTLAYISEQGGPDVLDGEEAKQLVENVNELQQEVWTKGFKLYRDRFPQLEYKAAYEGYAALPAFSKMVHSVDTVNKMLTPVINQKAPELRNRSLKYDDRE